MRCRWRLRIVPNARCSEVVGDHDGAIKIKVAAPALDGRANEKLIDFIAEALGLSRRAIRLVHGEKSRDKLVDIDELDELVAGSLLLPDA